LTASRDSESGFTLVEVIAAFAILALAFSVLMGAVSDGLRRAGDAEIEAQAASLAQSVLARAGRETPLQAGETSGQGDNGFAWRLRTEPAADAGEGSPVAGFLVTAEVLWSDGARERSLSLSTLRLGARGSR
jgi:general secretion pathway protein I